MARVGGAAPYVPDWGTHSFHDLRHSWATLALRAGVSPKIVSERLGHASVGFTLDVYAHAVPGWQAEAAATVADLTFGQPAAAR
jgi:integrase